jgi:hypothetical protein
MKLGCNASLAPAGSYTARDIVIASKVVNIWGI